MVVTDYPKDEQRPHKFKIAMSIFAISMLLALTIAGARADRPDDRRRRHAASTGVLNMDEAYAAINWKTVFLMACLIPLGWAMDSTGAAAWMRRAYARAHCRTACRSGCCRSRSAC